MLWENYCAERSTRGSRSGPEYSWTALGGTALLYEILIGVRPDALSNRIRWVVPTEPGWGLERIPLGAATVDLVLGEHGRITVATDRPFTLEVDSGGRVGGRSIPAGRWTIAVDSLPDLAGSGTADRWL